MRQCRGRCRASQTTHRGNDASGRRAVSGSFFASSLQSLMLLWDPFQSDPSPRSHRRWPPAPLLPPPPPPRRHSSPSPSPRLSPSRRRRSEPPIKFEQWPSNYNRPRTVLVKLRGSVKDLREELLAKLSRADVAQWLDSSDVPERQTSILSTAGPAFHRVDLLPKLEENYDVNYEPDSSQDITMSAADVRSSRPMKASMRDCLSLDEETFRRYCQKSSNQNADSGSYRSADLDSSSESCLYQSMKNVNDNKRSGRISRSKSLDDLSLVEFNSRFNNTARRHSIHSIYGLMKTPHLLYSNFERVDPLFSSHRFMDNVDIDRWVPSNSRYNLDNLLVEEMTLTDYNENVLSTNISCSSLMRCSQSIVICNPKRSFWLRIFIYMFSRFHPGSSDGFNRSEMWVCTELAFFYFIGQLLRLPATGRK